MSVTSFYWQAFLTKYSYFSLGQQRLMWLPFWPFEPFLSLMVIGLGTMILTNEDTQKVNAKMISIKNDLQGNSTEVFEVGNSLIVDVAEAII